MMMFENEHIYSPRVRVFYGLPVGWRVVLRELPMLSRSVVCRVLVRCFYQFCCYGIDYWRII
jgi:hypothetical protein